MERVPSLGYKQLFHNPKTRKLNAGLWPPASAGVQGTLHALGLGVRGCVSLSSAVHTRKWKPVAWKRQRRRRKKKMRHRGNSALEILESRNLVTELVKQQGHFDRLSSLPELHVRVGERICMVWEWSHENL